MTRYEIAVGWFQGSVTLGEACKAFGVKPDARKVEDLAEVDERAMCEIGEEGFLEALVSGCFGL